MTGGPTLRERAAEFTQPAHDAVEAVVPLVRNLFDAVQSFAREAGENAGVATVTQSVNTPSGRVTASCG